MIKHMNLQVNVVFKIIVFNLELNALKTVEMVVDFRKNSASPAPITLCDSTIDTVESFRFLGTIISQDLKWGAEHQLPHQESPAEDVLPAATEEIQP